MDFYRLVLFTHLAAMAGLFGSLAVEGVSLRFLKGVTSYEQAREWTRLWGVLPIMGAPSVLIALASGIYLATSLGLWEFGWTRIAVPTLVVVAVLGGIIGPHRNRVRKAVAAATGALPLDLQRQLRRPLDTASWRLRGAVLCALVFEMTTRSDAALLTMTPFAAVGLLWATAAWRMK